VSGLLNFHQQKCSVLNPSTCSSSTQGGHRISFIPLLKDESISFAAATTTGHDLTIPFKFDPDSTDTTPYQQRPSTKTVLVTFPLKGLGQSKLLTSLFHSVHGNASFWIQLGSTGIFTAPHWNDYSSPYDTTNVCAISEDELRELGGCVLDLTGLR
jgi:hypothetical protein